MAERKMAAAREPYTFDRVVRIIFTVVVGIGVVWIISKLEGVLLPFLVAWLVAYLLEPVVQLNMRVLHMKRRFLPVMLTLVEVAALLTGAVMLVTPYIVSECAAMGEALSKFATTRIHIPYVSQQIHDFVRDNISLDEISRWMSREEWLKLLKQTLTSSWNFVSTSVAFIVGVASWLIVLLYLVFIMLDYDRLGMLFRRLVPERHRERVIGVFDEVKDAMNRYFRGQFLIAMIVGVLFAIGFSLIGLPMGIVLGLLIGVLNLVPYLQVVSLPVTVVLCLVAYISGGVDFWVIFWESMGVYVVVQVIQDMLLTPKIMGKAMGLNPAIILLSLSIWGSLLGFVGLIIALPLTALLLSWASTPRPSQG